MAVYDTQVFSSLPAADMEDLAGDMNCLGGRTKVALFIASKWNCPRRLFYEILAIPFSCHLDLAGTNIGE